MNILKGTVIATIACLLLLLVIAGIVGIARLGDRTYGRLGAPGIYWVILDGHVYYRSTTGNVLVHSEACPCKNPTNR